MSTPEKIRVRITYEKGERIKFISHQDEFRLWERTLRRADLPLLYKQGYNPQPHIQFASPLGVGITGANEWVDITFSPRLPLDEIVARMQAKLPSGVAIRTIQEVPVKSEALQNHLIGADYSILIYAEPGELDESLLVERIDAFLAKTEIWRERERKGRKYAYNLRPLVFELRYEGYDPEVEHHCIFLRVQQRPGATGRPDEVVDALGLDDFARTLRRERLYLDNVEEDTALFVTYPVVEKQAIERMGERVYKPRDRRRRSGKGRTISERAADEFI
jgi:radical SAM-linked protein